MVFTIRVLPTPDTYGSVPMYFWCIFRITDEGVARPSGDGWSESIAAAHDDAFAYYCANLQVSGELVTDVVFNVDPDARILKRYRQACSAVRRAFIDCCVAGGVTSYNRAFAKLRTFLAQKYALELQYPSLVY